MSRSVCFFMTYHGRPKLTKMSIDHMADTARLFNENGIEATCLVVGASRPIELFCEDQGIHHEWFENDPVSDKFTFVWLRAIQKRTDYLCWMGSNNVHGAGYWVKAMDVIKGDKVATFGSRNCVIMSADKGKDETCVFRPTLGYLISSGQFFLRYSLVNSMNLLTIYDEDQTFNFDGKVLDAMTNKWGTDIIQYVEYDEEDCIDVKDNTNIHSYKSYMKMSHYPRYESSLDIAPRHPRLMMMFKGFYD